MRYFYGCVSFFSAFLLFMVQPMLAKALLPLIGGAPAVWIVSMMFFQLLLLAGYAYAAIGAQRLKPASQAGLHLLLMGVAILFFLPLSVQGNLDFFNSDQPHEIQLLLVLLTTIGLPYLVLSAHSSLLQHWYFQRFHEQPYHLFSASNIGSFAGLLGYPLVFEWQSPLSVQLKIWSGAYLFLYALFVLLAAGGLKGSAGQAYHPSAQVPMRWRERGKIILLSFFPSSLFLSVTLYITTDIASFPLLWVIPLALYLLSFAVAYSARPVAATAIRWAQAAHPLCLVAIPLCAVFHGAPLLIWLHFLFFFIIALSCHGHLSQIKPEPGKLTAYYFWLTVGGALGGIFNVLAPYLLNDAYEYFIVAILSLFALKGNVRQACANLKKNRLFIAVFLCVLVSSGYNFWHTMQQEEQARKKQGLYTTRNFFGVSRVYQDEKMRYFSHGTTMHGMQSRNPKFAHQIASYYVPLHTLLTRLPRQIYQHPFAVLGLGAGTLACIGKRGQTVDFYEIDQAVIDIAKNRDYFTYLSDCPPTTTITLGDGRLEIAKKPDGIYSLIVADAFTSDSVPMHLLTKEAAAIYVQKAHPQLGIIAYNISNRYLKLAPFIARVMQEHGWRAYVYAYADDQQSTINVASLWVIALPERSPWHTTLRALGLKVIAPVTTPLWSDDYSNLLHAFQFKW